MKYAKQITKRLERRVSIKKSGRKLKAVRAEIKQRVTADLDDDTLLTLAKSCGFDESSRYDSIWDGTLSEKQKKAIVSGLKQIGVTQYERRPGLIMPVF